MLGTALDVLVYAPLGLALQVQQELPDLAARGRAAVNTQGAMYRAVGEFAVGKARSVAEDHAGGLYDLLSSVGLIDKRDADPPQGDGAEAADRGAPGVDAAVASSDPAAFADGVTAAVAPPVDTLAIADYDTLPAAHILPLLPELSRDERDGVAAYESANRGRRTVLGRIERLAAAEDDVRAKSNGSGDADATDA